MISADSQPAFGPSMMPKVRENSTAMTSTWPTRSSRRGWGAFDSGTNRAASTMTARPIGMLTQKMARHPMAWTSTPPSTGPMAMLTPTVAPQTPMAWARSFGSWNTFLMMDMATGLSIEPPMAWTIRKTISHCRLGATLQRSELRVNSESPTWKVRLRPKRSAVDPESMRKLANTTR
jgi:hypothetical protein